MVSHHISKREQAVTLRHLGLSAKEVRKQTGVSERSQRVYLAQISKGDNLENKPRHGSGINHPNRKITTTWLRGFHRSFKTGNLLTDNERAQYLEKNTKISVSASTIARYRRHFKYTRKKTTIQYFDRHKQAHVDYKNKFLAYHHPKTGKTSLETCMTTDEVKIAADIARSYGYSRVRRRRNKWAKKSRKLAGGSYKKEDTRVIVVAPKRAKFKLNLVLTLSLDHEFPVVDYKLQDEYFDGANYSRYIKQRKVPEGLTHDLLDRASVHRAKISCTKKNEQAVAQSYMQHNVQPDFVPTGYPEFNPIEQCFNYLKARLKDMSLMYCKGNGWLKKDLENAVQVVISGISQSLVKSWYRNTFQHMYPKCKVPNYLL